MSFAGARIDLASFSISITHALSHKVEMAYHQASTDTSVPEYKAWFPCRCTQPPPDDEAALYAAVKECDCRQPTRLTFRRGAAEAFARSYTFVDREGKQRHLSDEQQRAFVSLVALADRPVVNEVAGDAPAVDAHGADKRRFALLTGCRSLSGSQRVAIRGFSITTD